jgi:hypothetical protein
MLETIDMIMNQLGPVKTIKVPAELINRIPPVPDLIIISHESPNFFFIDEKGEILSVQNISRD